MKSNRLVLVLCACAFASGFALRTVDPILPLIAEDFGVGVTAASALVTSFTFAYALSQPIFGPLGDQFGKSLLIVLCGLLLAASIFASAFAPNLAVLMTVRALSGFLAGAIIPVAVAIISELLSHEERQIGIARFLVGPITGQMLGAAASGAVGEWIGWRAVFVMSSVLVLVSTLAAFKVAGAARTVSTEVFGVAAIARRYRMVFSNPKAFRLYPLVFVSGAATFGVFPLVGIILQQRAGTGPFEAGIVLAGFGIGGIIFGITIRPVLRSMGAKWMGILGALFSGGGMAAFALPIPWGWSAVLFTGVGFFYYMMHNTIQTQISQLSREATGSAISIFALCMFTAQGVGPLVYGLGLTQFPTPAVLLTGGLIIVVVGCLGALEVVRSGKAA